MKIMKEREYLKYTAKVATKDRVRVLVLSDHGSYTLARECFHANGTRQSKLQWIKEHKLCVDNVGRVFCDYQPHFYMDALTGSLYKNGKCLGSDRLFVSGLTENVEQAKTILMNMKVDLDD